MKRILATLILLAGTAGAHAEPGPPIPSPLALATVPGLSADQQQALRKIFLQQRDAEEALMSKQRADFEALRSKARSEHERIDETTDASLRKLLGDDGYRKFAEWQLTQRPGPRGAMPPRQGPGAPGQGGPGHGGPGGISGPGPGAGAPPGPMREGDDADGIK